MTVGKKYKCRVEKHIFKKKYSSYSLTIEMLQHGLYWESEGVQPKYQSEIAKNGYLFFNNAYADHMTKAPLWAGRFRLSFFQRAV